MKLAKLAGLLPAAIVEPLAAEAAFELEARERVERVGADAISPMTRPRRGALGP